MQHAQQLMATAQSSAARYASPQPGSTQIHKYAEQHTHRPMDDELAHHAERHSRFPIISPVGKSRAPQASASQLALQQQQQQQQWRPQQDKSPLRQSGLFSDSLPHYSQAEVTALAKPHALPPTMDHAVFSQFLRSAASNTEVASSPQLSGNASGGASLTTYGSMSSDGGIIDDDSPAAKQRMPGQALAPSPTDEQFEHLERYTAPPSATTEGRGGMRPTSARSKHGSTRPQSARAAGGMGNPAGDTVEGAEGSTGALPRVEYVPPTRRSPRSAARQPGDSKPLEQGQAHATPQPLLSDSDSDSADVQQLSALPSAANEGSSQSNAPLHINAPPAGSLSASGSLTSPHRFIRRPPDGTPTPHGTKLCGHSCDMQFLHLCCSCSDKRGWQAQYLKYVDGVGDVAGQSRGEHYCPTCAQHWSGRDLVAWEDEEAEVEAAYKRVVEQAGQDAAAAVAAKDMAAARRARVLSTGSADDGHLMTAEAAAKQQSRAQAVQGDALATFDGGSVLAAMFAEDEEVAFED